MKRCSETIRQETVMDTHPKAPDVEDREDNRCQCVPGKEEDVNREQLPLLPAYCDDTLSVQAAEQLVCMAEDTSIPAHAGEDLPKADRAALLRKASQTQKVS
jgi:hypothetical protein